MERSEPTGRNSYRALVGKPGVVYVLENDGLRHGWLKIGCSARSGRARARDLNTDASTGTPGVFRCIYEVRTLDCGTAEQEVFARLGAHRRGKWGQEFFEVDLALAKETIKIVCSEVDQRRAAEPTPALATLPAEVTYRPPSANVLRPDRVPSGFATRRWRWRQSGRRPRRWWTAVAIVFGVVVILAAAQVEQKSQPAKSRPTSQAASSGPKVAKPVAGAKLGAPAQAGHDVPRPDGPRQAAASHVGPDNDSIGDSSVPPSPSPGAPNDVGSSSDVAKAVGKARDGEAPSVGRTERSSNAGSCSSEHMMQDPAAYSRCLNNRDP